MASYISDGYTRNGYIAAAVPEKSGERLYDDLRFTYRPATRMDINKLDAEIRVAAHNQDFDPTAAILAETIACKFVANRLVSWSLKDVGVPDVPVTADAVGRLQVYLFTRLYSIIRGTAVSDLDPQATKEPMSDADQVKN
jgi:hypothetical protein